MKAVEIEWRAGADRFVDRGADLDETLVAHAVQLSGSSYCSVISTIRGPADVAVTCAVMSS